MTDPVVTSCTHIYCYECLRQWLARSRQCPECRSDLTKDRERATTRPIPSSPSRDVHLHWMPDADSRQDAPETITSHSSLPSLRSRGHEDVSRKRSSHGRISWNLQRHIPLRNRAARLDALDNAPTPSRRSTAPRISRLSNSSALCTQEAVTDRCPFSSRQTAPAVFRGSHQLIAVDANVMLAKMQERCSSNPETATLPIRCRAITKCVWREWGEFLEQHHGRIFYADSLLKALSRNFERTIVEYGWCTDWRELPESYIQAMAHVARATLEPWNRF